MPKLVDFRGLADLRFPDDWSDERIQTHIRENEATIERRVRDALVQQAEADTAADPENQYLTPMEGAGVLAKNIAESGKTTVAQIPKQVGRIGEILPPRMLFGPDVEMAGGPQAQQFIADLERQRAGESPEALKNRIESNPFVQMGKAMEEAAKDKDLDAIPGSREGFFTGQVGQGIGTTVAGIGGYLLGGPVGGMATMFAAEAEDAWDEEMVRQAEAGERYNPDKALLKSLGYGAFASLVESKLGTGRLTKMLKDSFGGTAREAVKKASDLGALPKFLAATVKEAGAGFSEESIQRLGQSLIVSEGKEADVEGAVREGAVGAFVQSGLAVPANVVESRRGQDTGRLPSTAQTVSRMVESAGPEAAIVEPPDLSAEDVAALEGEITGVEEAVAKANRPDETKPPVGETKPPVGETKPPVGETKPSPEALPEAEPGKATGQPEAEAPNTILEQLRLTADPNSTKAATLIATGTEIPEFDFPELMQAKTKHGLVLFHPDKIGPDEIAVAAGGDVFDGRVLGMASSPETAPAKSPVTVSTSTPDARNVVTELVEPTAEAIQAATQAQQAAVPVGTTEVKPAAQIVAERREDVQAMASEPISPPSPQPGPVAGGPQTQQSQEGVVAPPAAGGVVVPPVTTFEQFAEAYRKAFAKGAKYEPGQIGFHEAAATMADLADAHPEFLKRLEAEEEANAAKPKGSAEPGVATPRPKSKRSPRKPVQGDSGGTSTKPEGGVQSGLQGQKETEGPVLTPAAPAPAAEAKAEAPALSEMEKAKADAAAALDDILEILGAKKNIVSQEQEAKLLVALTRLLDAGFRMGYLKFKEVARWALAKLREKSPDAADALTIDHLQGAYIAMAGRHQGKGADTKNAVISVQTKEALNEPDPVGTDVPGELEGEQPGLGGRVGEKGSPRTEVAGSGEESDRGGGAGTARPDDAPERVGDGGGVRSPALPPANNYRITDADRIGDGGLKAKFRDNVEAIRTLKTIEAEKRDATPEEQAKLVRFVGWGAMGGAFGEVDSWAKESAELRSLLTPEEYADARRSTQDAFYTSPAIVRGIHSILSRFGFTGGKMVEGGVGVGHFIGLMPSEWAANTHYTGVEKDGITARIAGKLYPKARILHSPFEKVEMARNYFDASTGNPPFGSQRLFDPNFKEESSFSIHNFFIAKQIALLRPGGVGIWVVSHRFLDKLDPEARRWISKHADFVGAIRLPNNAFLSNAGTKVVTDIVIFRKRMDEAGSETGSPWQETGTIRTPEGKVIRVNRWFAENPDMMLGTPSLGGKMYRRGADDEEFTLDPIPGEKLENQLAGAIGKLPENLYQQIERETLERLQHFDNTAEVPDVPVGSYFVAPDGTIRARTKDLNGVRNSEPVEFTHPKTAIPRAKAMIGIRDALRRLTALERNPTTPDADVEAARADLNRLYDAYVAKEGPLNRQTNRTALALDPIGPRVFALERDYDPGLSKERAKEAGVPERKPSAKKADIFSRRVWAAPTEVTSVPDAKAGLAVSLNQRGRVDIGYIAALANMDPDAVARYLQGLAFMDPSGEWHPREAYLSGNVREKLAAAREAAKTDDRFKPNVEELEKVVPPDLPPSKIRVPIGAAWIGKETIREFILEITGLDPNAVSYSEATGRWDVVLKPKNRAEGLELNARWGTPDATFDRIITDILNQRETVISERTDDGTIVDEEATKRAAEKAAQIKEKWEKWVMSDPVRATRLARIYNDTFNSFVHQEYTGSHLTLPGKSLGIELLPSQLRVAWRTITQRVLLYDHVVGAGKTFAGIAAFMEMRRLGIVRKPLFVVPNHLTTQWRDEWIRLYPGANILWAAPSDFEKGKRQRLFSRIANGDWDAVIIGHSSLKKLGLPIEVETEILAEQVAELVEAIRQAKEESGTKKDSRFIKDLEKRKESIEAKIAKKMDQLKDRDLVVTFDELGIDGMFVDEAHEFKNLGYVTAMMPAPRGLGTPESAAKSFDLQVKLTWLRKAFGGRSPLVFATGTPISNSLLELFHMMRYLVPDLLRKMGVHTADAFLRTFGNIGLEDVVDNSGTGFATAMMLRSFLNAGDLAAIYRTFADTISNADLHAQYQAAHGKRFPVPKVKGGAPKNVVVPRSEDQAAYFGIPDDDDQYPPGTILYRMENLPKDPREDNMLAITGDARKAGLDMRLVNPSYPDHPGSKINRAAEEVARIYRENDYRLGTQLVFCDLSIPNSAKKQIAEKKKEEQGKVFWIQVGPGEFEAVPEDQKPKDFKFEGQPDGYSFFSRVDPRSKMVKITERSSGVGVGEFTADTVKAAKDRAARFFSFPANAEKFKEAVADKQPDKAKLDAFLEQQIIAQAEKQAESAKAGDEDDLAEETDDKLTFDELQALSSPFSVYDDFKAKLVAAGIPGDQIQFIHDWHTPARKVELFRRMNAGEVRVLMGSTPKLGAGTNVQKRLVALHHLDAPWRPSDLEQREGRIIRQGNSFYDPQNPDAFQVEINRYSTELTYDARMWDIIEKKSGGIEDFKKADASVRELPDVRSEAANAAEMKAAASGNPLILEELNLRRQIEKAQSKARAIIAEKADVKQALHEAEVTTPEWVARLRDQANRAEKHVTAHPKDPFKIGIKKGSETATFTEWDAAKAHLDKVAKATQEEADKGTEVAQIEYRGITVGIIVYKRTTGSDKTPKPFIRYEIKYQTPFPVELGEPINLTTHDASFAGLLSRINNLFETFAPNLRKQADTAEASAKASAEKARKLLDSIEESADDIPAMRARHAEVVAKLKNAKEERKKAREAAKQKGQSKPPEDRLSTSTTVVPLTEGAQAAIERVKDVVIPLGIDAEVVWEPGWVTRTPEGKPWPIAAKAPSRGRPMQLNAAVLGRFTREQILATVEHEQVHPELATPWGMAQLGLFELTPEQTRFLQDAGYAQGKNESDADYAIRLKDEFVAHEAERNTAWWRNLLDKVREFLAKIGLAKLSNQEVARRILRSIRRRRAERLEDLLPEPITARLSTGAGPVPRGTTSQQGKGKSANEPAMSLPASDTGAPIQPGGRRSTSKAEFGAPAYIRQKERERQIFAENFIAGYGSLKEALGAVNSIEDSAFLAVTAGEIAARAAEDMGRPGQPGALDPVDAARIVERATKLLQAVKTDTAQGLQAQTQVNERLGAFRAVLSFLELIRTNQERVLGKKFPTVVSDNIRAWMRRSARIAVEAVAKKMKDPNAVFTKRLRAIAADMEIPWSALFQSSWDTQGKVQKGMYLAIRQHPDLSKLSKTEALELTNLFIRAWTREHDAIFRAEFAKAVGEGGVKVNDSDMKRLVRSLPRIVKWLNLGLLDDDHFRQAVAPEFGVGALDDADVIRLSELAQEGQRTPEGVRRNRIYQQMVDLIVASQGIKTTDLLKDFWFANVLSGLRTWIDVGVGSWLAAFTMTARAAADLTIRGKPIMAYRTAASLIRATGEGIANAADIIATGDTARLPDTQARLWDVLSGKGKADTLEASKRFGNSWQRAIGQMAYVRRIMVGLDYVGQLGARDAMLIYSAVSRGDEESIAAAMRRFDRQESQRAEEQARAELGAGAKWVDVQARKRELLEEGIAEEIKESAMTLGKVAALNADPVGFGGIAYRVISHMPWIARAPLGLSFARAAINMAQNATDWLPFAGLLNYSRARLSDTDYFRSLPDSHPMRRFGLDVPVERRRLIMTAQIGGLVITAAAMGIFLDDDDDERLVDINGTWFGVDPKKKGQLLSQGERPLSLRIGDTWISYRNTPFAAALAFVGNLRDKQRFRGESFDAESTAEKLVNAWILGALYIKDVSAMSQFSQVIGASAADTKDELASANKAVASTIGNTLSGFIPGVSLLREIDTITDPEVYRPSGGFEAWIRNIPFARRSIGVGPAVNALGDPIEAPRTPWGRWMSGKSDDPAWELMASLANRGVFLPVPSKTVTILDRKGNRRQMNPEEYYRYSIEAGKLWKEAILNDDSFLKGADPGLARGWFEKRTERIHKAARAKIRPEE